MDIGGDDAGAVALGRFAAALKSEDNYDMFFVVNFFRPLTPNAEDAYIVLKEVEFASSMKFTGIVNNSNLGPLTKVEDIYSTEAEIKKLCEISGLPLVFTSAEEKVCNETGDRIQNLFPLVLQSKLF